MFVYKYVNTVPKRKLHKKKYKLGPSILGFEDVTQVTDFIEVILLWEWVWGQGQSHENNCDIWVTGAFHLRVRNHQNAFRNLRYFCVFTYLFTFIIIFHPHPRILFY